MNTYLLHLSELRTRLINSLILVSLFFVGLFLIDEKLYTFIARPLLTQLPMGSKIIATEVTTPFTVPMKFALILAIFLALPYILYQVWSFIAPGLYPHEKQAIRLFLISSLLLFYSGTTFAYLLICPLALGFFANCAPSGIAVMTDIKAYLDFVLTILFAGGAAFQVPLLTLAVIRSKLISIEKIEHLRPYMIVSAFILGMLLTPPDVVSQVLLALPMWGLFEGGLLLAKYLDRKALAV